MRSVLITSAAFSSQGTAGSWLFAAGPAGARREAVSHLGSERSRAQGLAVTSGQGGELRGSPLRCPRPSEVERLLCGAQERDLRNQKSAGSLLNGADVFEGKKQLVVYARGMPGVGGS